MKDIDSRTLKDKIEHSMRGSPLRAIVSVVVFVVGLLWVLGEGLSVADPRSPGVTQGVKWHPGHYVTIMGWGKNSPKYLEDVYAELQATPALRGVQIRYVWAELEPAEGRYDFTSIDQRLAELAAQGKRLVIQVQTKSFDPSWKLVPDYLKAVEYDGGAFTFESEKKGERAAHHTTPRGYNIALWNPRVRDRLIALFQALGERYNSHPSFEGIGMIETAFGEPLVSLSADKIDGFYANLLHVHQQMRAQFPNTMTIQEVNYPRPMLQSFLRKLEEMGTALSSPDIFRDERGLSMNTPGAPRGIYTYYPELSGIVPLAPQVMRSNYRNTRGDGTGAVPAVSEILVFVRDELKANYIFWARTPDDFPRVLEMLSKPAQTGDPSGGLASTCPKAYRSCVE
jgi:Beta-galactosidase